MDLKNATEDAEPSFMDVGQLAALLRCSTRHVYRLAKAGQLPKPVRLGGLVRWPRTAIVRWIEDDCVSVPADAPTSEDSRAESADVRGAADALERARWTSSGVDARREEGK